MPDSPGDDNDSRTASVGLQRARTSGSSGASRASSHDSSIGKGHPRKKRQTDRSDVRDFVPQGAKFSAIPLDAEPDSTSSSGSDTSSNESGSGDEGKQNNQPPLGGSAPAINWNQGSKSAIRTTLGSRISKPDRNVTSSGFDEVNKIWRSRSASVSTVEDEEEDEGKETTSSHNQDSKVDSTDVELKDTKTASSGQGPYFVHSDDSESGEVSEGDDSIMVNVGARPGNTMESQGHMGRVNGTVTAHAHHGSITTNGTGENEKSTPHSKEDSFRSFSTKYPTPPSTLGDLVHVDLQTQVKYLFYGRDEGDLDLTLPVTCTECFQEGHLAEVCPSKEVSYPNHFTSLSSCSVVALKSLRNQENTDEVQCRHCRAWNQHESNFCPSWRRCQKCRARGHDDEACPSALKGTATEVPCDFCGSEDHLELDCDYMWKFPKRHPSPGPVLVSLSCCYCTSNHHLVGDCPSLPRPMRSSSWTLKGYDLSMVTNINAVVPSQRSGAALNGRQGGMRIRGRADARSPTPDSDDMLSRPPIRNPVGRNQGRPNIRFGSGIGKDKNLVGPQDSRRSGYDSRDTYRDRDEYPGYNTRQRSLSPNPHSYRGRDSRMKDSWQPPLPRSPPPRGPPRQPPRRGRGSDRGGRGGGRGRGRGGGQNGDAYRPMPSAAKKAWNKHRL
ncbi:zinc knuckle domain protein [Paecilomyces variotii No. 5]|uniref:Zinc knuckle domain protein n=1 Tax=Byssochlamys spectabilis (strain No. 5 / NBRC 109023) TaxID=1356009 RepID=V5FNY0_BYSSN|nr:zinc knuckle domain protein [Paecilomyces variotii No. 5]